MIPNFTFKERLAMSDETNDTNTVESLNQRIADLEGQLLLSESNLREMQASYKGAHAIRIKLEKELEIERLKLAACGVAALGYFEGCKEEYHSASLSDVLNLTKQLEASETSSEKRKDDNAAMFVQEVFIKSALYFSVDTLEGLDDYLESGCSIMPGSTKHLEIKSTLTRVSKEGKDLQVKCPYCGKSAHEEVPV